MRVRTLDGLAPSPGPLRRENMHIRLTDKTVRELPLPAKGTARVWDQPDNRKLFVSGFGLRLSAGGTRSFLLGYRRKRDGVERLHTIGRYPEWTTEAARDEALQLKRRIKDGADP